VSRKEQENHLITLEFERRERSLEKEQFVRGKSLFLLVISVYVEEIQERKKCTKNKKKIYQQINRGI